MFLFGAILVGVAQILDIVLKFVLVVMIISVILSWIRLDPMNSAARFVASIADPITGLLQRFVRTEFGALDLAPMIIMLVILFLQTVLVSSLHKYGCDFAGPGLSSCFLSRF